jgi:hypothetical protein
MMKKAIQSMRFSPAMLAVLLPLAGGCAVTARGIVTPPVATITAILPAPPTVVVTTRAPTATVVASTQLATPVVATPIDDGIELGQPQNVYAVSVAVAPPPPPAIVVSTPAPRTGYVWVGGHYRWQGGRWIWSNAQWIRERPGYVWMNPSYDAFRRVWIRGHWETRRSADTTVRPASVPVPVPAPAVATSSASTPSASVGFHVGFDVEAHASTH